MNNPSSSGSDPNRPTNTEPSRQQSQDAGSFSDAFESYQSKDLKSDLKSGAENLMQQSSSMLDDAKNRASELIEPAKERALSFAEEQKNAGAEQMSGFARVVRKVADDVGEEMPQAAGYIHDAAETLDNMSNRLRQNSVEDLFASIDDFARQRPMLFFGGALLLGFALTRFLKSSSEQAQSRRQMRSPGMHATPGEGWDTDSRSRMDSALRRSMPGPSASSRQTPGGIAPDLTGTGPVSSSSLGSSGAKTSSGASSMTGSPLTSGSGSAIPSSTGEKSGSSAQSVYGKEAKRASDPTLAGINPSIKGKQGDKS